MKLTGTNSSILQAIRQPTKLEESNNLVFIYPFIIDKSLDSKWGMLLRDFFSVQFVSQIKTSNILNITSSASRHSIINNDIKKFENPAESLAQHDTLGLLTNRPQQTDNYSNQYYNQVQKHEYQEKIDQFKEFIYNQVQIDPRFTGVNPVISSITVENLINIPLILGTKSSTVESLPLFWILFFATGQYREDFDKDTFLTQNHQRVGEIEKTLTRSIRLDREQSFDYIGRFIKGVAGPNYSKYEQYLDKVLEIPGRSVPSNRISKLIHSLDTDIDKALKVFKRAINERMYSDEIGFSRNSSVSITNAYADTAELGAGTKLRAQNLFTSFTANYIIPTVQSVINTLISYDEINVVHELQILSQDLISYFMDIYSILDLEIRTILTKELDETNSEASLLQLGKIEQMCQANSKLSVIQILTQFKTLSFSLTSRRVDIVNFIEKSSQIAAQLETYRQGIVSNLVSMSLESEETKNRLNRVANPSSQNSIQNKFKQFFDTRITPDTAPGAVGPPQSNRLTQLLGAVDITVYKDQICHILGSISSFMAYYTFFSYLCEYLGEVKAKVDVQKKDALDFPNYCLVFKREVVEALYGALAAANYKKDAEIEEFIKTERRNNKPGITNTIKSTTFNISNIIRKNLNKPEIQKPSKPVNNFTNFKINETDIMQMIRVLNNRLNIPNLIVVDEKSNTIYYKWMYSGSSVGKLTATTIQNYVQRQKEIL